jgi:hypothetical protein
VGGFDAASVSSNAFNAAASCEVADHSKLIAKVNQGGGDVIAFTTQVGTETPTHWALGESSCEELVLNSRSEAGGVWIDASITDGLSKSPPDELVTSNRIVPLGLEVHHLSDCHVAEAWVSIRSVPCLTAIDCIVLLCSALRVAHKIHQWAEGLNFTTHVWVGTGKTLSLP